MTRSPTTWNVARRVLLVAAVGTGLAVVGNVALPKALWDTGLGPMLLRTWGLLALFVASCVSAGMGLVVRLSAGRARDGRWALAFATGVLCFGTSMGALGAFGLLGEFTFWAVPLTLLCLGLPATVAQAHADWHARDKQTRLGPLQLVSVGFGAVCLALIGLQVINADNFNYDAGWYHLRAAERYALAGAQVRSPDGDMLLRLPQTAAWLYTWAFLTPRVDVDSHVVLAFHLELSTYVGTLALIPPLVRALMPSLAPAATKTSWVALFFFPSIFIYDTGIMGGADHVVALWSGAVLLAWFEARVRRDASSWAFLGFQLAGLVAKYSSIYLLIPFGLTVAIDAGLSWKKSANVHRAGPAVAGLVALGLTAPYWLRNWLWHKNPIYPLASSIFPSTPWNVDAAAWNAYYSESNDFTELGDGWHRAADTLSALVDHQLKLYTWSDMVGGLPSFGSGFFLAMLALPFVRKSARLWVATALMMGGVAVWFNTHQHHMRYLTVLTPVMAAAMAAVALYLWHGEGFVGKAVVASAVGLLLAAYADVPFRHTHRMSRGKSPAENGADLIARRGGKSPQLARWVAVGESLPLNAVPMVHGTTPHLGLGRQSRTDCVGLQFGVNYGRWGSVPEVYRHLRAMGVTHLIWPSATDQADSVAGEILFHQMARATVNRTGVHGYAIGELPLEAPAAVPTDVLYLGCSGAYPTGLYELSALAEPIPPRWHPWPKVKPKALAENWRELLPKASALSIEEGCDFPGPYDGFEYAATQGGIPRRLSHYLRQH